jgi:uncharacterized protein (DUF885 family)
VTTPAQDVARTLVDRLFAADPFDATELGARDYDALVPDPSAAAEERLAADLDAIATLARSVVADTEADAVTLEVVRSTCERTRAELGLRSAEYTVTPMPIVGPARVLAVLARASLVDARAAGDLLERLRGAAGWIDGTAERLREGAAAGRYPVVGLVDNALGWVDSVLADPVPAAAVSAAAPDGWTGASEWAAEREALARESLRPALVRWRDRVAELRATARPDEQAGLAHLPGGAADYAAAIAVHTTLPGTAEELHEIGRAEVERLERQAARLGAELGLDGVDAVRLAARASADAGDPEASIVAAREAVRRAEARAADMLPPPAADPCAVSAMPPAVGASGMAAHYTRPRDDGSRPGTFWFNTMRPTVGTGWDLEAVAFHETVPGHHSQFGRLKHLPDLPPLQQFSITVHSEGWGLYAERLAGEFGLYSDVRAQIGSTYIEMHRAARLVVDTGLHAFGWSRQQARDYMVDHVALPESALHDEVDRYIAWPGQALAYLVGQREILRLRALATEALGDRFDLRAFNGTVLEHGSVPMPVLAALVDRWIARSA